MTPREREVLDAIHALTVDGVAPTYDQIAGAVGLKAKSGVHRVIASLEAQGKVRRRRNCQRGVEIVGAPSLAEIVMLDDAELNALASRVCQALDLRRAA